MTLPTNIVFARVISLRASHRVDVKASEIGRSKQNQIGKSWPKFKVVSIIVIKELVDHHMSTRNEH